MPNDGNDYDKQGPSYLDGVQVKISEKYKPPRKVTLPVGFQHRLCNQCYIPEYSFGLEKHVLSSMTEWRKRRKEIKEARRERLQIEHETQRKEEEEKAAKEEPQQEDASKNESVDEPVSVSSSHSSSDSPTSHNQDPPVISAPSLSASTTAPSNILTPVPFLWSSDIKDSKKDGQFRQLSSFNISDFESDTASPFDNEELKTLNDMEELAHVLQPLTVNNKVNDEVYSANVESRLSHPKPMYYGQFPDPHTYSNNTVNAKYHQYAACDPSLHSNKTYQNINGMSHYNSDVYCTVPRNYGNNPQNLTNDQKPSSNSNLPMSDYMAFPGYVANRGQYNFYSSCSSATPPASYMNSTPSMISTMSPSSYVPLSGGKSYTENVRSLSYPVMSTDTQQAVVAPSVGTSGSSYLQTKNRWQVPGSESIGLFKYYVTSPHHGSSGEPLRSAMRSSRSVPDLVEEQDKELQKQQIEEGPARRISHTPPPRPSSMGTPGLENWSPWPELDSPAHSGIPSKRHQLQSNRVPSSTLPNPVGELSKEVQEMAHRISEMGFPIARVARACQKLGADDKKVVEFLLQIQTLEEQGFDSDLVETALSLHRGDAEAAETYLNLTLQFMDLGFPRERISQALLLHNNNRDQALDFLVS